jgi:hypothetical protein
MRICGRKNLNLRRVTSVKPLPHAPFGFWGRPRARKAHVAAIFHELIVQCEAKQTQHANVRVSSPARSRWSMWDRSRWGQSRRRAEAEGYTSSVGSGSRTAPAQRMSQKRQHPFDVRAVRRLACAKRFNVSNACSGSCFPPFVPATEPAQVASWRRQPAIAMASLTHRCLSTMSLAAHHRHARTSHSSSDPLQIGGSPLATWLQPLHMTATQKA